MHGMRMNVGVTLEGCVERTRAQAEEGCGLVGACKKDIEDRGADGGGEAANGAVGVVGAEEPGEVLADAGVLPCVGGVEHAVPLHALHVPVGMSKSTAVRTPMGKLGRPQQQGL